MSKYHKLVRDNIPGIIRAAGQTPKVRTLNETEYLDALLTKLEEEVAEFKEAHSLEELADVQEVVLALLTTIGATPAELEAVRIQKQTKNGAFAQRIFLESVE